MKTAVSFSLSLVFMILSGCAEIKMPTPLDVLKAPLGRNPVDIGMAKAKVLERWGDPDEVNPNFIDEEGEEMEKWTYFARYPEDPFQINYLSKNKYIYFIGDRIVKIHE